MPFLTLNNVDLWFIKWKLIWKSYTTAKTLPTTWRVQLISKNKYYKVALDKNIKVFVIYVSFLNLRLKITVQLARKVQIALLLSKKVTISVKYLDFANWNVEITRLMVM